MQPRENLTADNLDSLEAMRTRVCAEVEDYGAFFRVIGRTTESFGTPSDDWAGWPTELEKTCVEWTEAFKGMPLRRAVGQPSRLVHVQSGKVVCPGKPVQYAAVSYAWSQWEDMESMLCRLRSLMEPTGLVYAWIDQKCVIQDSEWDKKTEIGRMRDYYAQAAVTYVMVPEWSTTFTWELAGFVMTKEQAARAAAEVEALKHTEWASRVWTMQEALLSGRTVLVGKSEVKSAVELAVASTLEWLPQCEKGHVHASWQRKPEGTNFIRVESPTTSPGLEWASAAVNPTHILRDSVMLTDTSSTTYRYLDDVWRVSGKRNCALEEDRVYGMLGLLRCSDVMTIEYGIGFEEAVRRAAETGLVSYGILLAETVSPKKRRCWCPRPGTEGMFSPGTEGMFSPSRESTSKRATTRRPIQLTPDGLCRVQAARFRIPREPESLCPGLKYAICKNLEGGEDFQLKFDNGAPADEECWGDWLAVVELKEEFRPIRATLVKYETHDDRRLTKLQALDAEISFIGGWSFNEFLLG